MNQLDVFPCMEILIICVQRTAAGKAATAGVRRARLRRIVVVLAIGFVPKYKPQWKFFRQLVHSGFDSNFLAFSTHWKRIVVNQGNRIAIHTIALPAASAFFHFSTIRAKNLFAFPATKHCFTLIASYLATVTASKILLAIFTRKLQTV